MSALSVSLLSRRFSSCIRGNPTRQSAKIPPMTSPIPWCARFTWLYRSIHPLMKTHCLELVRAITTVQVMRLSWTIADPQLPKIHVCLWSTRRFYAHIVQVSSREGTFLISRSGWRMGFWKYLSSFHLKANFSFSCCIFYPTGTIKLPHEEYCRSAPL